MLIGAATRGPAEGDRLVKLLKPLPSRIDLSNEN